MLNPVNLEEKLSLARKRDVRDDNVLKWVQQIFDELDMSSSQIIKSLKAPESELSNTFIFDKLDSDKVFHIDQIRKVCINYRLRFLDTKFFKGDYPEEVISKIGGLEKEHATKLGGFKIIAPSKLFVLKKADDPLLFAPMGNGYYYLIHKWGKDLHPLRKLKVWPLKNLNTIATTTLLFSFLITFLTKDFVFNHQSTPAYALVLFLFVFKFSVGFILYYGISSGKNFNELIWRSKYDKIQ